jgi:hypothetical protein
MRHLLLIRCFHPLFVHLINHSRSVRSDHAGTGGHLPGCDPLPGHHGGGHLLLLPQAQPLHTQAALEAQREAGDAAQADGREEPQLGPHHPLPQEDPQPHRPQVTARRVQRLRQDARRRRARKWKTQGKQVSCTVSTRVVSSR